jgi:hypothetical protein
MGFCPMKDVNELIPWKVTDISIRPYEEMWSMNPSIHFDGSLWRCVLRCTDYAMPNGVTIRSAKARPAGNQTKNAMVIFDPQSWRPIQIFKMHERDDEPRATCANVGYEDMRLFKTDRGGLQGIAASLHLERVDHPAAHPAAGGSRNQPPEQVLLSFDEEYNIVTARPIRGDWWSGTAQKNWVPFDHCAEPRFLYSIGRGMMFDDRGALHGDAVAARASSVARAVLPWPMIAQASSPTPRPSLEFLRDRARLSKHTDRRSFLRGSDMQVVHRATRGRRVTADVLLSRPTTSRYGGPRGGNNGAHALGTGRALPPKYEGLRGGSQLVRVSDDAWLGLGHEMQYVKGRKYYWHVFYLVDSRGKMMAASVPMKLAANGIEFAAGMVVDGERVVVSFGVDDMECKIGETRLSAVMGILKSVEQ